MFVCLSVWVPVCLYASLFLCVLLYVYRSDYLPFITDQIFIPDAEVPGSALHPFILFAGELIPPNSDLAFEVTLLNINDGDRPPNVFKEIDANDDKFLSKDEVI